MLTVNYYLYSAATVLKMIQLTVYFKEQVNV